MADNPIEGIAIFDPDGERLPFKIDIENQTVWATQAEIAKLFETDLTVITKHIRNIIKDGELAGDESNVQKRHITGVPKPVSYYNLDMIISVGYRVNSVQATRFRQWATATLRQYIVNGYALDETRLPLMKQRRNGLLQLSVESARLSKFCTRRFERYSSSVPATMTKMPHKPNPSLQWPKISFIMPLQERPLPKLS